MVAMTVAAVAIFSLRAARKGRAGRAGASGEKPRLPRARYLRMRRRRGSTSSGREPVSCDELVAFHACFYEVEQRFRAQHGHRAVSVQYDEHLAALLDAGYYTLDAVRRPTRLAIKQLGLAVAEQLA